MFFLRGSFVYFMRFECSRQSRPFYESPYKKHELILVGQFMGLLK